jgi:hypothetical protein
MICLLTSSVKPTKKHKNTMDSFNIDLLGTIAEYLEPCENYSLHDAKKKDHAVIDTIAEYLEPCGIYSLYHLTKLEHLKKLATKRFEENAVKWAKKTKCPEIIAMMKHISGTGAVFTGGLALRFFRGDDDYCKVEGTASSCTGHDADIYCFQENKAKEEIEEFMSKNLRFKKEYPVYKDRKRNNLLLREYHPLRKEPIKTCGCYGGEFQFMQINKKNEYTDIFDYVNKCFDLSCCKVCYDGKQLMVSEETTKAIQDKKVTLHLGKEIFLDTRVMKYSRLGFDIKVRIQDFVTYRVPKKLYFQWNKDEEKILSKMISKKFDAMMEDFLSEKIIVDVLETMTIKQIDHVNNKPTDNEKKIELMKKGLKKEIRLSILYFLQEQIKNGWGFPNTCHYIYPIIAPFLPTIPPYKILDEGTLNMRDKTLEILKTICEEGNTNYCRGHFGSHEFGEYHIGNLCEVIPDCIFEKVNRIFLFVSLDVGMDMEPIWDLYDQEHHG